MFFYSTYGTTSICLRKGRRSELLPCHRVMCWIEEL